MPRLLTLAPADPAAAPEETLELALTLDPTGQLDAAAWLLDPDPWPVRWRRPGRPPTEGDVQHDDDYGWALRFFPAAGEAPDVPLHILVPPGGPLRPGEVLSVLAPNGIAAAWRIVGLD